jgi:hypothetical protein
MRTSPFYDAWLFLTGSTGEHEASWLRHPPHRHFGSATGPEGARLAGCPDGCLYPAVPDQQHRPRPQAGGPHRKPTPRI